MLNICITPVHRIPVTGRHCHAKCPSTPAGQSSITRLHQTQIQTCYHSKSFLLHIIFKSSQCTEGSKQEILEPFHKGASSHLRGVQLLADGLHIYLGQISCSAA